MLWVFLLKTQIICWQDQIRLLESIESISEREDIILIWDKTENAPQREIL